MRASRDGSDVPVHLERNADMWSESFLVKRSSLLCGLGPTAECKTEGKWYIELERARFRMSQKVSCCGDDHRHVSSGVGSVGHDNKHTNHDPNFRVYLYIKCTL